MILPILVLVVLSLLTHNLIGVGGRFPKVRLHPPRAEPSLDEYDVVSELCRRSFYEFVKEFWDVVIAEDPVWNWHIRYLCDQAQEIAERVFKGLPAKEDLVVNVPPGTTKSTIFSVMLPAWIWTRMPSARVMCASHTYGLGQDLQVKCREVVLSEKYRKCFPEVEIREDQNTKGYFRLTRGGMRFVATVAGVSPMGFHAHFLIVDDPIDPKAAISEADVKAANHWMTNALKSRKINKVTSVVFLIMQRLAQNDPTGERLNNKKLKPVRHICLPAELTDQVCPKRLAKKYVKGLLDARRLPPSVLKDEQANGQYYYAGQFLQNPIPLGGALFKTSRLKFGLPPKKFRRLVRYWDKAGTEGGGAFTVGVLMGRDFDDRYWVIDVVRVQLDSFEREELIKSTAKLDPEGVTIVVEQEPGSGGKESAQGTIRRLAGFSIHVDIPKGRKELRADPYSVQVNAGNVYLVDREWATEYVDELKYFPRSRYKDQVDASSGAFAWLSRLLIPIGPL